MDIEGIEADGARERGEARAVREGRLAYCHCGVAHDPGDIGECACCCRAVCEDCEEKRVRAGSPTLMCPACAQEADAEADGEDARDRS